MFSKHSTQRLLVSHLPVSVRRQACCDHYQPLGALAMENHLLQLYAINSMGLLTAAVVGSATQLPLLTMLLLSGCPGRVLWPSAPPARSSPFMPFSAHMPNTEPTKV